MLQTSTDHSTFYAKLSIFYCCHLAHFGTRELAELSWVLDFLIMLLILYFNFIFLLHSLKFLFLFTLYCNFFNCFLFTFCLLFILNFAIYYFLSKNVHKILINKNLSFSIWILPHKWFNIGGRLRILYFHPPQMCASDTFTQSDDDTNRL